MGVAAGTANTADQIFKNMQGVVARVPADYRDNYAKKNKQAEDLARMATEKAKNVFFEEIPSQDKIPIPDSKTFVKLDESIKPDFNQVPPMNDTLRHVVPPEVRKMQGDLQTQLQNLID